MSVLQRHRTDRGLLVYRLSRRGNRQLNHAIHVAAVSQISHRGSEGYASTSANAPKG
jgi:hypothetical protein